MHRPDVPPIQSDAGPYASAVQPAAGSNLSSAGVHLPADFGADMPGADVSA